MARAAGVEATAEARDRAGEGGTVVARRVRTARPCGATTAGCTAVGERERRRERVAPHAIELASDRA